MRKLHIKSFFCFLLTLPGISKALIKGSESSLSVEDAVTFPAADNNNTMTGFAWFKNGFTFEDNTTSCTFDALFPVSGDINLNGGDLYLLRDLHLASPVSLSSMGSFFAGGRGLILDSDISELTFSDNNDIWDSVHLVLSADLTVSSTVTIRGDCIIDGNESLLKLNLFSHIVVASNSSLTLRHLQIKNVSSNRLRCFDNSGKIILDGVTWIQDGNYTFSLGSMFFEGDNTFLGGHTFSYESPLTSTVEKAACCKIRDGMTFSIGRNNGIEPLYFEDHSAQLQMENCTFRIASTGVMIDRGTFVYDKDVRIELNSTDTTNGMVLGDGFSPEGAFDLLPGAQLTFSAGHVVFDSIVPTAVKSRTQNTRLIREAGSIFHVQKNVNLSNMSVEVSPFAQLLIDSGNSVEYDNVTLVSSDWNFDLKGSVYDAFTLLLNGDDSVFYSKGTFPLALLIVGTGNKIHGTGSHGGPIIINDSTAELTVDLNGILKSDVTMNGGKLILGSSCSLGQGILFGGDGIVKLSSNRLKLGSQDLSWTGSIYFDGSDASVELNSKISLSGTWTFSGNCTLDGGGKTLDLSNGGKIFVDHDSSLNLNNITLKGVCGSKICCKDGTSKIVLDDVIWVQCDDYLFDEGSLLFKNKVVFSGDYTFSYESPVTSTIENVACWRIGNGMTLSIGRNNGIEPLYFEDHSAKLRMENCIFRIASTGIIIDRGTFTFDKNVRIELNSTDTTNGMVLGDGFSPEGAFDLLPGAQVTFSAGHVVFDSIVPTSIKSRTKNTRLIREAGSIFHVQKNVNLSNMSVEVSPLSQLIIDDGKAVEYEDVALVSTDWDFDLKGSVYNAFTLLLNGDDSVFYSKGTFPLALLIVGTGNKIHGTGSHGGPIIINDSTAELTVDLNGILKSDITMNGGKFILGSDCSLGQGVLLGGEGTVNLGNNELKLGAKDLSWTGSIYFDGTDSAVRIDSKVSLSGTWTFSGNCTLDGDGKTLDLSDGGKIFVDQDSSLRLKNIKIKCVYGNKISCKDGTSKIILDDVTWVQCGDYTFDAGSLVFKNSVYFVGEHTFFYESPVTSTIERVAHWEVGDGMTLSIGRNNGIEPLYFEDHSAKLCMENCTFRIAPTGVMIDRGTFIYGKNVRVELNSTDTTNGMVLGDGFSPEGAFDLLPGAQVTFSAGHVVFDSIVPTSIKSRTKNTRLIREAGSIFHVQKNVNLSNMSVEVSPLSQLIIDDGKAVEYEDVALVSTDWDFDLKGSVYNAFTLLLNGDDSVFYSKGTFPLALLIVGTGNKIHGTGSHGGPIIINDSTAELTVDLNGILKSDVAMNGGKLILGSSCSLGQGILFGGEGIVNLSSNRLKLGSQDLSWTGSIYFDGDDASVELNSNISLSGTWTFSGNCTVNGNGNILNLGSAGNIVIESGSQLVLKNIVIKEVSAFNIRCLDNEGKIILSDVYWHQDGNYTFSQGAFFFEKDVKMFGAYTFAYQSSKISTICSQGLLALDQGFTFSYDPIVVANKNLLVFSDYSSQLVLKGATLHTTETGLCLTRGNLKVKGKSNIESESYYLSDVEVNEGITLGNSDILEDMDLHIDKGSVLQVGQGSLLYKNVDPDSLKMENNLSILKIKQGAALMLYETMDVGDGIVEFESTSTFGKLSNRELLGPVVLKGKVYHRPL